MWSIGDIVTTSIARVKVISKDVTESMAYMVPPSRVMDSSLPHDALTTYGVAESH
jgi:hypothetical protein